MANVAKGRTGTINSADNYQIFNAGGSGGGGVWTIQLDSSSFDGSITVKARALGATAYLAIDYTPRHLNGSASDSVAVSTAITGTSLIQIVIADGMEVSLDCTMFNSGSMTYKAFPSAAA